jgi:hypothetical protein
MDAAIPSNHALSAPAKHVPSIAATESKELPVAVFNLSDMVDFVGTAKDARHFFKYDESYDKVPAERSTHTSTITFGLKQSRRTLTETVALLKSPTWQSWADKDREIRNRHAGKPHLAT